MIGALIGGAIAGGLAGACTGNNNRTIVKVIERDDDSKPDKKPIRNNPLPDFLSGKPAGTNLEKVTDCENRVKAMELYADFNNWPIEERCRVRDIISNCFGLGCVWGQCPCADVDLALSAGWNIDPHTREFIPPLSREAHSVCFNGQMLFPFPYRDSGMRFVEKAKIHCDECELKKQCPYSNTPELRQKWHKAFPWCSGFQKEGLK
jgi:hypothetical protein